MFVKEYLEIDLNKMSYNLQHLNINRLNIFCVEEKEDINKTYINNTILLVELGKKEFIELLNQPKDKFIDYNKESLYVIRNSSYINIKQLFNKINDCKVNIGRGGGIKNQIACPLEIRFFFYIMAMFNFQYDYVCHLNNFNNITKDRYLPFYFDKNY